MLLFFDSEIEENFQNFTFDKSESRHISKVLRKNVGSQITITNGKGLEWKGEITSILNQKVEAKKITSLKHSNKKKHIHLSGAESNNVFAEPKYGICPGVPLNGAEIFIDAGAFPALPGFK